MSKRKEHRNRAPASEEAKRQGMSGDRGAEAEQAGDTPRQPPQTSGRRPAEHEQAPDERKGYPPGQAPSAQGDGDPTPRQIARDQQGEEPRSGSHTAHGERSEETAQRGEPADEHTRTGRQHLSGDRPRKED